MNFGPQLTKFVGEPRRYVLPVPPLANRYWRHRVLHSRAITYKSDEARAYGLRLRALLHPWPKPPTNDPVVVTVRWYQAQRRGDLDGVLKALLDSLQGIAYQNDRQIVELHAYRDYDPEQPRVEVTIDRRPPC